MSPDEYELMPYEASVMAKAKAGPSDYTYLRELRANGEHDLADRYLEMMHVEAYLNREAD